MAESSPGTKQGCLLRTKRETHNAWKNNPVHFGAQRLGHEKFYSEFKIRFLNNPRSYPYGQQLKDYCTKQSTIFYLLNKMGPIKFKL